MLLLLISSCICVSLLEKRIFGTIYLPTSIIFWPIIVAAVALSILGPSFGFHQIADASLFPLILGLYGVFFGEIIGASLKNSLARTRTQCSLQASINSAVGMTEMLPRRLVLSVVGVCLCFGLVRLLGLLGSVGASHYFASDGLDGILLTGPVAHIVLVGYALCPLLLRDALMSHSKIPWLLWAGYILLMFCTMVKYHPIFLIIASVIYCLITDTPGARRLVPMLAILPIVIFMSVYIVNFMSSNSVIRSEYLVTHLMNYLFGGTLYSSIVGMTFLPTSVTPVVMLVAQFAPLPNLVWNSLTGATLFEIPQIPFLVLGPNGETGNVCNLITVFFLQGNWLVSFICVAFIGFIASVAMYRIQNSLTGAFLAAALLLAFFGDYFTLTPVWEVLLLSSVLPLFLSVLSVRRKDAGV